MAIEMSCDIWEQGREISSCMAKPDWKDIQKAILLLDGQSRTVVRLQSLDKPALYMLCYGPFEKQYGVNATDDDFNFFNLINTTADCCLVKVFVGGQVGSYPRNQFVAQSLALEAAQHFLAAEERKGGLPWVSQY